jgi:hypothetical protein
MKPPSAFLRAIIAFARLLPLNVAAFARRPAPPDIDEAIQRAEDGIQKLKNFINGHSISSSYGPNHLKFFFGSIIRIKGLTQ